MSQAPTLEALFDFTTRFETAARAVLTAAGVDTITPRSVEARDRSDVSCGFVPGSATDEMSVTPSGSVEHSTYRGCELAVVVQWPREVRVLEDGTELATPDGQLPALLAKIRVALRQSDDPLNPENLLYYQAFLRPNGEQVSLDEDMRCDVITLRWSVDFMILPEAWPAS